ncbi:MULTISPECIES: GNAT family N-acetyltransferase [unclassified Vibrio]|uniref:GNAT family N-acetyltransferase n=1 Tax=unclassified Vibrio TaxID=2614977 RepID=UPI001361265E|nr:MULTISPECIES: GNAT family N-acetyltransferase [unclassified Vibrio]NAW55820.1 GNAT family N-acetyltransferase [Vibrio sp. V36_P2S2PM302]NAX27718.1 GNAT family N-acetyltransferase [Vibrio sp. V38_P2S17PM301]NAX31200.1 GNAT family N-acetyltransferase [Vibrio sp. V37_P2S8PM304]
MKLIYTFTEEHITDVYNLYQQAWWAKERTLEQTARCLKGSQLCIGIVGGDNNLIGFARVITDFTFKALIFDVIVCSSQRNSGLGAKLISAIQSHEDLNQVQHFELYCLPEMRAYYEKFGFSTEVGGVHLMRQANA